MSWSILLLPLLGGYYYLTRCINTKHRYRRLERQRLIFDSSILGFIFLLISFLLCFFLKWHFPEFVSKITIIPINIAFFYTSLSGFLLALVWTNIFNITAKTFDTNIENWYLAQAIKKTGNSMQQDLLRSYFNEELLMFTLRNGKVYVGLAIELSEPDGQSYIRILPFYSGYRNEKYDVELVTDYLSVYQKLEGNDQSAIEGINTETVICEDDIVTTTFYQQKVFDRFVNDK